jgi:tetratricopeptide (TPR) repeat protein
MTGRREKLESMLKAEPQDAFLLYALAHEHAQAGDLEEAIARFDAALAAEPAYCYAYFHKAKCLDELGRHAEAAAIARAGYARANAVGDVQAAGELRSLLEELAGQEDAEP